LKKNFGRLKQLMDTGKEKGYVLYDEVNELLTEEYPAAANSMIFLRNSTAPASRSWMNPERDRVDQALTRRRAIEFDLAQVSSRISTPRCRVP